MWVATEARALSASPLNDLVQDVAVLVQCLVEVDHPLGDQAAQNLAHAGDRGDQRAVVRGPRHGEVKGEVGVERVGQVVPGRGHLGEGRFQRCDVGLGAPERGLGADLDLDRAAQVVEFQKRRLAQGQERPERPRDRALPRADCIGAPAGQFDDALAFQHPQPLAHRGTADAVAFG